jgi:2-C-methyl-D-erythritol 4-phosphate cytidylyltransferase/2-C-methyl-D-erythritol 2,4-cyclodiphosphate synthase
MPKIIALIVAAGKGHRFGGDIAKQWIKLDNRMILQHSLAAFLSHPDIHDVRIVIHPDDQTFYQEATANLSLAPFIAGGETRQESVRLGLESLIPLNPDYVLIHDGARPFIKKGLISRIIDELSYDCAILPALPVVDTLKRAQNLIVEKTLSRDHLYRAQTPQAFPFLPILKAHQQFAGESFTDDSMIAEQASLTVKLILGCEDNIKITTPIDYQRACSLIAQPFETRVGNGYDVHRFKEGDYVTLCNLKIPHHHSLEGHSDADVGLHALTDALLGALSAGDIGRIFSPHDPRWKGADSALFLRYTKALLEARGAKILHLDLTLICESPKIGPYRRAMELRLSELLDLSLDRLNVKATTTEGLGFTGREEGIAAQATATLAIKPL